MALPHLCGVGFGSLAPASKEAQVLGSAGVVTFAQNGFVRIVFRMEEDLVLPCCVTIRHSKSI